MPCMVYICVYVCVFPFLICTQLIYFCSAHGQKYNVWVLALCLDSFLRCKGHMLCNSEVNTILQVILKKKFSRNLNMLAQQ
jgi:hypothetical protein